MLTYFLEFSIINLIRFVEKGKKVLKKLKINCILRILITVLLIIAIFNNSSQAVLTAPGNNRQHWEGTLDEVMNHTSFDIWGLHLRCQTK